MKASAVMRLYYYPINTGDGAVSVEFFSSEEKMSAFVEAYEASEWFEPWGTDCSGWIEVSVDGDKLLSACLDPKVEAYV